MSNKKLSDFKALLFDVDRTLTDTKRNISRETLSALSELSKQGFQIGVCTGRGTSHLINKVLPLFPENSLHITTSGARLIDSKGNVIWEKSIDEDSVVSLRKYIDSGEMLAIFFKNDGLYTIEPIISKLKTGSWDVIVKDFKDLTNNGVGAIYIPKPNKKILDEIKNNENLDYNNMLDNDGRPYIDVSAKGVNKAATIKIWSEHTGIPVDKIIGFGDSLNDLEFLKICGFGVAMGNSVEELKQVADRVIGHTDDNSLAKYLLKIIQGGDL